jgi:hypothetical protein
MPAVLRIRLRPPSHPTRYCAVRDWPSESVTSTPVSSCTKPVTHVRDRSAPRVRRPRWRGCARYGFATAPAHKGGGWEGRWCPEGSRRILRIHLLSLGQEAIRDSALVENLNGPRVQTAGARAGEGLTGAPLDNGEVDPGECQLARQHQARRTASGDPHDRSLRHSGRHPSILRSTHQNRELVLAHYSPFH